VGRTRKNRHANEALEIPASSSPRSVVLRLEYEEVCKNLIGEISLTEQDIEAILDYFCRVANHRAIFYLWRPHLKDPKDDMVLELAVAAGCTEAALKLARQV
jgi:hypothetical protein